MRCARPLSRWRRAAWIVVCCSTSIGSKAFFRSGWPKSLRAAGVKVVEVLPVGAWRIPFQRQDLRMHRKLVVIDDRVGYTGSMNMVDPRFFKQDAGVGQWVEHHRSECRGPWCR